MFDCIGAATLYFLILTIGSLIVCAAFISLLLAWFLAVRRELRG